MAENSSRKPKTVSSARTSRVAARLQEKVRDGHYYEAHQSYKALYQRYRAQRKEKEAVDLLYEGAVVMLESAQVRTHWYTYQTHTPCSIRKY